MKALASCCRMGLCTALAKVRRMTSSPPLPGHESKMTVLGGGADACGVEWSAKMSLNVNSWLAPPSSYVSQRLVKCQGPYRWRKHAPGYVIEWWVSFAPLVLFVPPWLRF